MTERFNRTMKEWLNSRRQDWEEALPEVLLSYRATTHNTTQVAPFELMFGREPRILLDAKIQEVQVDTYSQEERQELE